MRPRTGFTYLCTLARPIDHPRVWNIPKEITDGEDHACQYCRNCNSLLEEPRPERTFCSGGLTLPCPSNRARLPSIICGQQKSVQSCLQARCPRRAQVVQQTRSGWPAAVPLVLGMSPSKMGTANHALKLHGDPLLLRLDGCTMGTCTPPAQAQPSASCPASTAVCIKPCILATLSWDEWRWLPRARGLGDFTKGPRGVDHSELVSVSVTCRPSALLVKRPGNPPCARICSIPIAIQYIASLRFVVLLSDFTIQSICLRRGLSFCNTTSHLNSRVEALTCNVDGLSTTSNEKSSPTLIMR